MNISEYTAAIAALQSKEGSQLEAAFAAHSLSDIAPKNAKAASSIVTSTAAAATQVDAIDNLQYTTASGTVVDVKAKLLMSLAEALDNSNEALKESNKAVNSLLNRITMQ